MANKPFLRRQSAPRLKVSRFVLGASQSMNEQDAIERAATSPISDKHGVIVRYEMEQEAFPLRPEIRKCGWCPYRSICSASKEFLL